MLIFPILILVLTLISFLSLRYRYGDGGGCLPVLCCSVVIVSLCGMEGCSTTEDSSEDAASLLQAIPASGEGEKADKMVLIPAGAFTMGADDGDAVGLM